MRTLQKIRRLSSGNSTHEASCVNGAAAPKMTVRVGCRLIYETTQPTPIFLLVRPRSDNTDQLILSEMLTFPGSEGAEEFQDGHGNITHRWTLPPGQTVIV